MHTYWNIFQHQKFWKKKKNLVWFSHDIILPCFTTKKIISLVLMFKFDYVYFAVNVQSILLISFTGKFLSNKIFHSTYKNFANNPNMLLKYIFVKIKWRKSDILNKGFSQNVAFLHHIQERSANFLRQRQGSSGLISWILILAIKEKTRRYCTWRRKTVFNTLWTNFTHWVFKSLFLIFLVNILVFKKLPCITITIDMSLPYRVFITFLFFINNPDTIFQ